MDTDTPPDPNEARANALYWESDDSVNQIAEDLSLSKGSLYGMIHPMATGLSCPSCHAEMEYPNRTARDRGYVTCPSCGLEEEEDAVRDLWEHADAERGPATGADDSHRSPGLTVGRPGTERVLAGTALLAVAAGFVLGRLSKRS